MFPIEVKIYAADQIDQCSDYYSYARSVDPNAKIYYLTLDRHKPSDESKRDLLEEQYECISFSDEILLWLDDCLNAPELERIYSVREILIQFRDVIRNLTGRQKGKMMDEIKTIIEASYENVMAAMQVSRVMPAIRTDKMREVFAGIKKHMTGLGFAESSEDYFQKSEGYYSNGKLNWPSVTFFIHIPDISVDGKVALCFEIGEYLYMGIIPCNSSDGKPVDILNYVKEKLKPAETPMAKNNKYWYWMKNLNDGCLVHFMQGNNEYYKLYDKKGFEDYMNGVYSSIDSILRSINLIK